MKRQRKSACVAALAVGLMLVLTTDAMAITPIQRERVQNARITKVIRTTKTIIVNVAGLTKTVGQHTKSLATLQTLVNGIDTKLTNVDGRVGAIEAGVPAIIAALTKLGDGLTTVGAGLTKLGDAYQAVEYGRAGIFPSGAATPTLAAGGTVTSADIPDDGNAITTGENAIVVAGASGLMAIDLKAAIRSNESDGDDASKTAGQAGGYLYVVNLDTGVRVACGGAPNPPGIFGTTAGDPIVTPTGTVNTLPLKNIPGGVLRTDTTKPDASSTSLLPAPCQFGAAAGTTYQVRYSVNFLDIPTSTTPGPKE
jgi:hypothetical protein